MATLLLKATDRCNARCRYCFAVERHGSGVRMTAGVADLVMSRVGEFLEARPDETVDLLWHGGEPLLLGRGFFRHVMAAQSRLPTATAGRIRHSLQTNLTLLDEPWLDLLADLPVRAVGTSYEPIPGLRGLPRRGSLADLPALDSAAYNRRFGRAVERLEARGIPWSVIYVVTRPALGSARPLLNFLLNLVPSGAIALAPVLQPPDAALAITPAEYAGFLGDAFDAWWPRRHRHDAVQPFVGACAALREPGSADASVDLGFCQGRSDQIEVDPAGTLGHACVTDTGTSEPLGHLGTLSLAAAYERQRAWLASDRACDADCPLRPICLPRGEHDEAADQPRHSRWCEARVRFVEEHLRPIAGAHDGRPLH